MESKNENIIIKSKMLDDADLSNVNGGAGDSENTNPPKYKVGDIVFMVINQPKPGTDDVYIVTVQCQITSDAYKGFYGWGQWCYDCIILAQDAVYEGCPLLAGRNETEVEQNCFDFGAKYKQENGITF